MRNALLVSILGALTACESEPTHDGRGCLIVPAEQTTCPPADSLDPEDLFPGDQLYCDERVVSVWGQGRREQAGQALVEACCYAAEITGGESGCVIGRPYWDGGVQRQAPLLSSVALGPAVDAARA